MRRICLMIGLAVLMAGSGTGLHAASLDELRAAETFKPDALSVRSESGMLGLLAAGGPDLFGYSWIDSDEPGGPVFDWVDITAVGTPVPFPSYVDDGNVGPVPIGFDFPFYDGSFNELYACSNGWLSFTNSTLRTYTNQPLPNSGTSVPENLLAPWWDDMVYDESDGNEAYFYNDGSRFIIEYFVRRIAGFTPPYYRFQVILYPDGRIVYQYHTLGVRLDSTTIGLQNGAQDDGLTVVHNDGSYPHENLAILFVPPVDMMIDIRPGGDNNPINLASKGVIPVAILTTETFDALAVDASTIAFGPLGAPIAHVRAHVEDVDHDGDLDLLVHFRVRETGIQQGDTEACLSAKLLDGRPVQACDMISIVPQG